MAEEKQEKTENSKPQETGPAYKEEKPNPEIKAPKYSIGIYTTYKKKK
jgi:hypothetical protein